MIAKAGFPLGVLLSVVCTCAAWGQNGPGQGGSNQNVGPVTSFPTQPDSNSPIATSATAPQQQDPSRFMSYMNYDRPDCCGPVGRDGPIHYELYSRTGPDIIAGGGFLAGTLDAGWMYEGGGRSLFFNPTQDMAWVVDLGFTYQYNHSSNEEDFTLLGNSVHVSSLQRAYITLGGGQEFYLWKTSNDCGPKWRVGWEAGGRYGSARLDLNFTGAGGSLERVSDTIGGAYAGLHTDFEYPCCDCCTLILGFRAEWDYTWSNILPQRSDVMDVNLMVETGVRF